MAIQTDPTASGDAASPVVIVLTTLPADADAEAVATALIQERLAACVSIGAPMISVFSWKGEVERAGERQLVLKTVADRVAPITSRLAALHPYDVPELLVLPIIDGGEAYLAWVRECTAG
jgi:periplasmic divalent cation tolerance protein